MPGKMTRSSVMKKKKKAPMKAMSMKKSPARAMSMKSPSRAMSGNMKPSSMKAIGGMVKKKKKTGSKNKMSGSSKFQ